MDENSQASDTVKLIPDQPNEVVFEKIIARLTQWEIAPKNTVESKKIQWSEFLSIWSDILQFTPDEAKSCYEKCANLFSSVFQSTDFFSIKRDPSIARLSHFTCIAQFNQPHIKAFLELSTEKESLAENRTYYNNVRHILFVASQSALFISFRVTDAQEFTDKYTDLITSLIERIDRAMPQRSGMTTKTEHSLGIINESILSLIWNLSNGTILVPFLLKCSLAKKVISWVGQASMINDKGRRPLISITHNISRHDDGADELNQLDAIPAIKKYQQIKVDKVDFRNFIGTMTLALLSTPEQIKQDKKGMNAALNELLQLAIRAAKNERFDFGGFHVSEPLCVLVKMFVVEERTLDYILCHAETEPPSDMVTTIHLFISLFMTFQNAFKGVDPLEQFTLITLLNIFWSISFQASYSQELITNEPFIMSIRKLLDEEKGQEILEQYKPRSMEGAFTAARGILHNLHLDNKTDMNSQELNTSRDTDQQKSLIKSNECLTELPFMSKSMKADIPWIMISYCHADDAFCSRILELFSTHNETFHVWIDRTHCQSVTDLWESIAEGMERASCIVSLLSGHYVESKSCRQEFIYAIDSLKKSIVPVLLGNFEPKGWLGIRMSGLKYIRFRDLQQPDSNKLTELLNTILTSFTKTKTVNIKHLSAAQHYDAPVLTLPSTSTTIVSLPSFDKQSWSVDDIHNWFAYHHISKELRDLFDFRNGEEMIDYSHLLIKDREKQMNIYGKVYTQKYAGNEMAPHEFTRFSKALEGLCKDYQPISPPTRPDSNMKNKTSVCTII